MKVIMELIKARQEWDPESQQQSNYLDFAFAGRLYSFEVTEEQMIHAIQASQGQLVQERGINTFDYRGMQTSEEDITDYHQVISDSGDNQDAGYSDEDEEPLDTFESMLTQGAIEPPPPKSAKKIVPKAPRPTPQQIRQAMIAQIPHLQGKTKTKVHIEVPEVKKSPQSDVAVAMQRQNALRQKARERPPVRVAADEMGYPIVNTGKNGNSQPHSANNGVEVVSRGTAPEASSYDEDGFMQG